MGREESRSFKLFAKKMETKGKRKDLELFDYVRDSGDYYDEEEIHARLYPGKSKNTLHRLKSRLIQEINKSLVLQNLDNNDTLNLFHMLSISEYYFTQGAYELVSRFLHKAEKLAVKLENFVLLDLIYQQLILLSHQVVVINPEEYIQLRKENQIRLNQVKELDEVLAAVIYRLRTTQNFGSKENSVAGILEKTLQEFAAKNEEIKSPTIRLRIAETISRLLLDQRDFVALEEYLTETYARFKRKNIFTKSNHDNRLRILTFLMNTLNKNEKYEQALVYAEEMLEQMKAFDRLLYDKYASFYYNGLAESYRNIDKQKTIQILMEMREDEAIKKIPYYLIFAQLNLTLNLYEINDFKKAIKEYVKIAMLDGYSAAAPEFRLKVEVFELLLRFQLKDMETLLRRMGQIRRDYRSLLGQPGYLRDRDLLKLIRKLANCPNPKRDLKIRKQVDKYIKTHSLPENEKEEEIIDYEHFLKDVTS